MAARYTELEEVTDTFMLSQHNSKSLLKDE
jgi:hypothetical protein